VRRLILASSLLFGFVALACVGDEPAPVDNPSNDAGPTGADATADTGGNADTGGGGVDSEVDATPACGVPSTPCCAGSTCQGGAECKANACACPVGKIACGNACVDTQGDVLNCGRCGHDCVGGACTAGQCKALTVAPGQSTLRTMVIDGGRIYFTRSSNNFVTGGFFSVKLDGTDLKPHYEIGLNEPCSGLAITQGKAYFICKGGANRRLLSCDLPACTLPPVTIRDNIGNSAGPVAADPATGKVFYSVITPYNQSTGGGVFDSTGAQVGAVNQPSPVDVRVSGAFVYWLNGGTYATDQPQKNGGVRRASLTSLGTETTVMGANTIYFDNATLAVDSANAYYAGRNSITSKSDVVFAPSGGGGLTVFAADLAVASVVSDGTNVFFDDNLTHTLRYCPRVAGCGGGTQLLAESETDVSTMTFDDKSVVWARGSGEIRRIAKP
jgi:hypothetical protein